MAAYYRARDMTAVVFTVDATTTRACPPIPNDEIAEAARAHPDVLIPFGSVDPHLGQAAVPEVRRLAASKGPGVQVPPQRAGVPPQRPHGLPRLRGHRRARPRRPVPHRSDGIGAGVAGGGGIRLKSSNPMDVDDVAADFPELDIVLAHPSFPWQDEAIAVALHKPQVNIDLSGWSPKYFRAARAVRQLAARRQGPVRLGLPDDHARTWWPTSRPRHQARGPTQDPEAATPPACSASSEGEAACGTRDSARGPPAGGACPPDGSRCGTATPPAPTPSWTTGAAAWPAPCRDLGVGRGDRVAYLGPNDPALLETLFATGVGRRGVRAARLGGSPPPSSPTSPPTPGRRC